MDPVALFILGLGVVIGGILVLRLHPFLALLIAALLIAGLTAPADLERGAILSGASPEAAEALSQSSFADRVADQFGATAGNIGIIIAMAAIIGKCLLESGAADRVVRSALRWTGEKGAPMAFSASGFLLAVPVYFDTVFYLMIPLGKAMGLRHPAKYGIYVMSIIAGGTMAHSLVPPTPGPLLVASSLGVDLSAMIIGGFVVGAFTCAVGFLYARWASVKWPIPLRDSEDVSLEQLRRQSNAPIESLPSLTFSLLPIVLPIVLITLRALLKDIDAGGGVLAILKTFILIVGDKNVALTISAVAAMILLASRVQKKGEQVGKAVAAALASGGVIILITSAGGAFGGVLRQTGISETISGMFGAEMAALPLAFFVTALVRTAQGSATVAMITSAGVFEALLAQGALGFHPVYLALAIGCGSKPFPWMNDSGFWIISRMSGMTEAETIKAFSVMISLMGLAGLLFIMLLAAVFPMTS